jgi:creatinine amidohydrolase/Fe(II)-dependent formamide hydrolase-like protein
MHAVRYEELTWPDVADLPRDLPMVLPLGEGYDPDEIARELAVDRFSILPAVPYGWAGSVLPLPPGRLRELVAGILSGPKEDGFTHLAVVHAGNEDLESPGVRQIRLNRPPDDPASALAATPQRVILIPSGHTEQHAYHLPMNVDTVIIDEIARGVVAAIPDKAETLPTLPYGVSTHRSAFAGTFNVGGRTFEDTMLAIIDVLVARGADRFYLISGHGGSCSFLVNAVKYAGERHPGIFAATTWLHTSGREGTEAIQKYRRSEIGGMGHSGELETSFMLHLRPDLCHMDRVVDETDFIATPNYMMDWVESGALAANPPWEDDTTTGSYGAGSLATAENGARWLQVAIEEKIVHVREIHEQQNRRLARRAERKKQP